jgi:hypothetical protein
MKTRISKNIAKQISVVIIVFLFAVPVMAQHVGTNLTDQGFIEERKENTSTYTVGGPGADEYSWEVIGGTVVVPAAGVTGAGTSGDPYVVPFTVGLQSIQVEWPDDDSTITSVTGNVSVQRQAASGTIECPSSIQSLDVVLWSNPTITIEDADYEICSGDATLTDSITVTLTGAPNFTFRYTITDLDGTVSAVQEVAGVTAGTSGIPLPTNLLNSSSTDDQTYIITITEMFDAFDGFGTIVDGSFTITVHPTVETGPITSDSGLTRR